MTLILAPSSNPASTRPSTFVNVRAKEVCDFLHMQQSGPVGTDIHQHTERFYPHNLAN